MKPQIGDQAPDFTAPVAGEGCDDSSSITLSALRGSRVVLVFYPKDQTPGCTTQACALRDGWQDLPDDVKVYGVSIDDVKSHRKFIEKQHLPYPLIADTDKAIVERYGVWVEKSMYGKKYMGTERSTFVIGKDGSIESVLEKVAPKKHLELLKEALA
ncbi:peroxiredoxin [Haloferula chungangensis]|uniref:thioredoxin-dependent peroxiredoxin n=1 Tax=Haloferula chungangensis TaxID=1048331 RepID=A0ABW2L2Q0_9BACT